MNRYRNPLTCRKCRSRDLYDLESPEAKVKVEPAFPKAAQLRNVLTLVMATAGVCDLEVVDDRLAKVKVVRLRGNFPVDLVAP